MIKGPIKRLIILTGSELRHTFLRKALSLTDSIEVLLSVCEGHEGSLTDRVASQSGASQEQLMHLRWRAQSERDFFFPFIRLVPDSSNALAIKRGELNSDFVFEKIKELNPDLILAYGCSIVRDRLIDEFEGKILNLHLGLSPYYRGSGTNFWPLVNEEPEFVGSTVMYMDKGIDTGKIIHQLRARVYENDGPHQIGNRLICDSIEALQQIILNFEELKDVGTVSGSAKAHYYRKRDFSPESVVRLYRNFESGMIQKYLEDKERRIREAPLCSQPMVTLASSEIDCR